jgi:hypothetical protein
MVDPKNEWIGCWGAGPRHAVSAAKQIAQAGTRTKKRFWIIVVKQKKHCHG